jgi:HPt (histidine-containing phosphotransfer) domain-containing protein
LARARINRGDLALQSPSAAAALGREAIGPADRPIDLVHLARMTFGDRSLEREVLQLFARQSATLLARMSAADPAAAGALAHTLNGSARGLGAWRVAAAAEAVEKTAPMGAEALRPSMRGLQAAVDEARAIIDDLLQAA